MPAVAFAGKYAREVKAADMSYLPPFVISPPGCVLSKTLLVLAAAIAVIDSQKHGAGPTTISRLQKPVVHVGVWFGKASQSTSTSR